VIKIKEVAEDMGLLGCLVPLVIDSLKVTLPNDPYWSQVVSDYVPSYYYYYYYYYYYSYY